MYTPVVPILLYKSKEVYITWTCYPDGSVLDATQNKDLSNVWKISG